MFLLPLETFSFAAANFSAAQWLADEQARQQHLYVSWYESIASISSPAGAFGVLKHPSQESHGRDHFIYQNHVGTDNGTAGYSDVRKALAQIRLTVVCALSIPIVFVLGDQQSFSRMVWLKRKDFPVVLLCYPLVWRLSFRRPFTYGDAHALADGIHALSYRRNRILLCLIERRMVEC